MAIPNSPDRTKLRRRLGAMVAAAGLAGAMLFSTAGAAAAASPAEDPCPFSGALCLFDGPNFTGERFTVTSQLPGGSCVSLVDHGWGERAQSAINTHGSSAAMFFGDDCIGGPYQVPPNSGLASLGTFRPASVWVPHWSS